MARPPGLACALGALVALGCAVAGPAHADGPGDATGSAGGEPVKTTPAKPTPATKPTKSTKVTPATKPTKSTKATQATKSTKSTKRRARRTSSSASAHITSPSDAPDTPAVRYARLSQDDCEAELTRRSIDFVRETGSGVLAPVRLTGALHGVVFRTDGKDQDRAVSPYEIADCRLVLALDDFAEILSSHDIVEVRHYSIYRPPHGWPADRIGGQHNGGLALDAGRFIDKAGKVLNVDHDFHGAIGAKTCGDGAAPRPSTADALALRAILCEAVDRRLFNVVLTPNYNRPHHNHFHLEVMAGVSWFLVH